MRSLNFYANGSARNHGCEALTRSLYKIYNKNFDCSFASFNVEEDKRYISSSEYKIYPIKSEINKLTFKYGMYLMRQYMNTSDKNYYQLIYGKFMKGIRKGEVYCSIGGDNYSYGFSDWLFYLNQNINKGGGKTILLGCSIFDKITDKDLLQDLSFYEKIICRESLTFSALKQYFPKEKIFLIPDPAFQLDRVDLPLPEGFVEGNTVGINVSPMIIGYEKNQGMTLQNYKALIQYIIDHTDMQIALIPHVVWSHNDDRIPLQILYDHFKETGRVCMIGDHNAEELKGFIARCRFMVVARTHASIAAYSQEVPTLVVGYSVKARGIARDLFGTDQNYVIPVQSLQREQDLVNSFIYLMRHEQEIKAHLESMMPEYKEKVWKLINILDNAC